MYDILYMNGLINARAPFGRRKDSPLREALIKSLSDFILVFLFNARNQSTRIASYLRRLMRKRWIKIHMKFDSANESVLPKTGGVSRHHHPLNPLNQSAFGGPNPLNLLFQISERKDIHEYRYLRRTGCHCSGLRPCVPPYLPGHPGRRQLLRRRRR